MVRVQPVVLTAVLAVHGIAPAQEQEVLIQRLDDESTRRGAADALVRIGDPRRLLEVLHGDREGNQREVLLVLARMRNRAEEIVPDLLGLAPGLSLDAQGAMARALADLIPYTTFDVHETRDLVVGFLGVSVGRTSPEVMAETYNEALRFLERTNGSIRANMDLHALISHLQTGATEGRALAAELLGERGRSAQAALPALRRVLLSSHPMVQRVDARSIEAAGGQINKTEPVSLDPEVRSAAATAMENIAPGDPVTAVAAAHRLLHDPDGARRVDAAMLLGRFGAEAAEVVPQLVRATEDEDLRVAREAVTALGMLGPPMASAIPDLQKLTANEDRQIAGRAQAVLRRFDRFADVARGEAEARDVEEHMHAALFAYGQGWLVSSARLYTAAITAEDYPPYSAIAAAARAGIEAEGLDDAERGAWRRQALQWTRQGVEYLRNRVRGGDIAQARNDLWRLLQVSDLAPVRRAEALAKLPDDEARAWADVWDELEDLCERAWPAYSSYRLGVEHDALHFALQNAQQAVQHFQAAVEQDPGFGVAYASLAYAQLWMYWEHAYSYSGQISLAREALDKAVELEPDHPKTHWAEGYYAYYASRDYESALQQFSHVVRIEPSNSEAIAAIGFLHRRLGNYEQAAENVARALELNPQDNDWMFTLGQIARYLRRYEESEQQFTLAIEHSPEVSAYYLNLMRLYLNWDGDTKRTREVLAAASERFGERRFLAVWTEVDKIDGEYRTALERLEGAPVNATNNLRKAHLYELLNDLDKAGEHYAQALAILEGRGLNRTGRMNLAFTYAGLGRKAEAMQTAAWVVSAMPISRDALTGVEYVANQARIFTRVGELDQAIDNLEILLSIPSHISIPLLRVDPKWDRLRHLPRFQALFEK